MGTPGVPTPLRAGQALPPVGAWGQRVSPHPCARAAPLPSRGWGVGTTGFPTPLRAGGALTFPRVGRGDTRCPHTPACGRRPPKLSHRVGGSGNLVSPHPCVRARPSRGRGRGGTRVPHAPLREPMFTVAVHAAAPHNAAMKLRLFLGGLRPPKPSQGAGPGCAGRRPASAEVWGNPVSPHLSSRAYVHVSRPCDSRRTPTG